MLNTQFRVLAIAAAFVLPPSLAGALAKPSVEVAFVLDTTGSMAPLIEGAKRKIWSIATAIVDANPQADIRMGLVAYRDIGDEYVTKTFPLTPDLQDLYANLLGLKARGGGDWPESVNEALHVGVSQLAWNGSPETTRIVFLVGDAPPHMDYPQDTKYPAVVAMARERGIIVNAVQAGAALDTERVWRSIAQLGNGRYIPIPQDGGEVAIVETPFDAEIFELQKEINGTVIPYGPRAARAKVVDKVHQFDSAPAPVANEFSTFMAKRKGAGAAGRAVTGDGDLVADVAEGRQRLDALKDEELSDDLRKLAAPERKAAIDKQVAQRGVLNDRMRNLVAKRDAFAAAERARQPTKPSSFDRAVAETLSSQVKK